MNKSKVIHHHGWVADLPDHRDVPFQYKGPAHIVASLPPSVNLKDLCSPVENQLQLGSCTANALVGNLEFLEKKAKSQYVNLSRLFIYYNERVIERTVSSDSGAMLRDGIKTLRAQGVCGENIWPYRISKFKSKPSMSCYKAAKKHVITSYHRIVTLADMKACLAEGYPFVFGFTVYTGFESSEVERTGIVNMPQPGERVLGGHAVMAVGYDEASKRFTVRNSWGPGWGQGGYFTIPYDYVGNINLAEDMWTIRK